MRYQADKLKEEIRQWHERRCQAVKCLGWLCLMECDPRLCNAEGQSVLDLCATKHPEVPSSPNPPSPPSWLQVQDQIRRQWEWMVKREIELEAYTPTPYALTYHMR